MRAPLCVLMIGRMFLNYLTGPTGVRLVAGHASISK